MTVSWSEVLQTNIGEAANVAYSPTLKRWVALESRVGWITGAASYSDDDGLTWQDGTISGASINYALTNVIWCSGLGLFVCCESGYYLSGRVNNFDTSADGKNWTQVALSPARDIEILSLAYSPVHNCIVAFGHNGAVRMMYTADGLNWSVISGASDVITSGLWVSFLNKFIAFPDCAGTVLSSPDGLAWTIATGMPAAISWNCAGENGALVIALASYGGVAVTTDGSTWTDTLSAQDASAITYDPVTARFYIMGGFNTQPAIVSTADGYTFTPEFTPASGWNYDYIAAGNGIIIAGGYTGYVSRGVSLAVTSSPTPLQVGHVNCSSLTVPSNLNTLYAHIYGGGF